MAKSLFSKQGRIIWSRRIKGFWADYKHNKVGLFGLSIVALYAAVALTAPLMTPYDPLESRGVANGFAMPQWVTALPQYSNLPPTMELSLDWGILESSNLIAIEEGTELVAKYNGAEAASVTFISDRILYPYSSPREFLLKFTWWTSNIRDAEYSLDLFMINPAGTQFVVWTSYHFLPSVQFSQLEINFTYVSVYSKALPDYIIERLGMKKGQNLAQEIFQAWPASAGEYKFIVQVRFRPTSASGTGEVHLTDSEFKLYGLVHGLLGTDSLGRDVFSQLIFGTRISLAVGLFSAFLATSLGILVGIIAGYAGGPVDEALMRTVDILLCLPVLPLLLALIILFGANVWYLVILIAVFGWQGLSRVIRSQVLSLKEMPFIECAKAAGASKFYVMLKHILPNVIPVALAALILSVPAAILTEAAISFIGLGDPAAPTWGKMLHYGFQMGGFSQLAWWWIVPPGLAITILTLSFVFIGHAVDEVVNPRLRRRR